MNSKWFIPVALLVGIFVLLISLRTGKLLGHDLNRDIISAYDGRKYVLARCLAYPPAFVGNSKSEYVLGALYLQGRGGSKDFNRAFQWIGRAALQGQLEAQTELAHMYAFGLGPPQDYGKALEWYGKAAAQGWPPAQHGMGFLHRQGWGVPQDYYKAVEWFRRAAGNGWKPSMASLGVMYERGLGVPQDNVEAYKWWKLSEEGFKIAPASSNAQALKMRMTPARLAEAEKRVAEYKAAHPAKTN